MLLFNPFALLLFLPLLLASPAPYNPFPPPTDASHLFHGRSAFTPELLAAYKSSESVRTTPAQRVLEGGKHFKRGVSSLVVRGVGQGRATKIRVVKRAAFTCVAISSSSASASASASSSTSASASASASSSASASITSSSSSTQLLTFGSFSPKTGTTTASTTSTSSAVVISTGAPVVSGSSTSAVLEVTSASPSPFSAASSSSSSTAVASTSTSTSSTVVSSSSSSSVAATPSPSTSTSPSSTTSSTSKTTSASASASASPSASAAARLTVDPSGTDGPFSGWGTWYDVGLGSCGKWDTPDQPIVAISAELMNSWPGYDGSNPNNFPMCGKHMKITWRGKSAIARVADQCPGCAVRSLDMSKGLFEQFASLDVGLLGMDSYTGNITWSWIAGEGALASLPYTA